MFATDSILSTIMCAPRSVYSWDIVVQRVGNKLFFDKRDGSQLDMLSVNETAQESLPEAKEDINSAPALSVEATFINQNFSQQVKPLVWKLMLMSQENYGQSVPLKLLIEFAWINIDLQAQSIASERD